MQFRFKALAAVTLALASVGSFATDLDPATVTLATPLATDVDSGLAIYDGMAADATDFAAANAVIVQLDAGGVNVAVIDQTGTGGAAIVQAGTQGSTAYIVQSGATNLAGIVQR